MLRSSARKLEGNKSHVLRSFAHSGLHNHFVLVELHSDTQEPFPRPVGTGRKLEFSATLQLGAVYQQSDRAVDRILRHEKINERIK